MAKVPTFIVSLSITLEADTREAAIRKSLDIIEVLPAATAVTIDDLKEVRGRRYYF